MRHYITNADVNVERTVGAVRFLVNAMSDGREDDQFPLDPATMCLKVRRLAYGVYRAKRRYGGDSLAASREWERLEARIDHLQDQLETLGREHQLRLAELLRWLSNLRGLVQAHGKA